MRERRSAVLVIVWALSAAGAARAQGPFPGGGSGGPPAARAAGGGGPGGFGDQGVWAISGDFQISFAHQDSNLSGVSQNQIVVAPAADYFLAPRLSLGGQVGLERVSSRLGSTQTVLFGARVGYEIPLGETLSLWPKGGLEFASTDNPDTGAGSGTFTRLTLVIFAPFLLHPAQHFFIGLGPEVSTDLVSRFMGRDVDKTTRIGITSVVGGWFGR